LLDPVVESHAALADELEHDSRDERLRHARNAEAISNAHGTPRLERRRTHGPPPRAGPVAHERDYARRALRAHLLEHRLDVRPRDSRGSLVLAPATTDEH
jgi:hypothetical protein